jgi:hypothetical protein
MPFDYEIGYSFSLLSSLLIKVGREKEKEAAKSVIKRHAFLLDL